MDDLSSRLPTEPTGQIGISDLPTEFVEARGLRFELATAGDQGSSRLALLLHGFPEHFYSWRFQMPLFAKLGYKCWAPNQRGYGKTTRPSGIESYSIDNLVADVEALVEASGCESVTLVGHDWGGFVACTAALRGVARVERLVLMNIPHPRRYLDHVRGLRQLARSWYVLFFQLPRLPEYLLTRRGAKGVGEAFRRMALDKSRFPDAVLDVYRDAALQPGAMTAMINWYRAAFRHGRRWKEELESAPVLRVPTLMIWGEVDPALGVELTYDTEALVEDFTVRYLPGVSHWVQQEAPEAVNEMLEAWLTGRPVPGARISSLRAAKEVAR
jgi:pimeloyl-ACP methyl ester carboxylesterase